MLTRLTGALVRALIVGVLLMLTVSTMPDISPATADAFGLVTIAICVFIILEYGYRQPALLEFRFAAPYNRWRFITLITIMLGFVVLCGNVVVPTPFNICVRWFAEFSESALNFTGSPVTVMEGLLRDEITQKALDMIPPMASMGYMITLISTAAYLIYLALNKWPAREESFHFWSNLPTFHSVQPQNAGRRLMQIGILSAAMAIVFPYAIPFFLKSFSSILPIESFVGDFTLFWIIAVTTWLPLACAMRGFSLIKVSRLIQRDQMR